jgi:hypothetical protein
MPIMWKSQFTMPFIAQCLAGKVRGPKSFAGTIATTYDLAIKTGFPMPPAPPVPLLTGKKKLLQVAIMIGMLQLLLIILKALSNIKGRVTKEYINTKSQLNKELNSFNKELNRVKDNYSENVKDLINTLDNNASQLSISLSGDIETGYFATISKGIPCEKVFVVPLEISTSQFNNYETQLNAGTTPTNLTHNIKISTKKAFNLNSTLLTQFNENARSSLQDEIKKTSDESKDLNLLNILKKLLLMFGKKMSIFSIIILIPTIIKSLIKAHTDPITKIKKDMSKVQQQMSLINSGAGQDVKIQKDILKKNLKLISADLVKANALLANIPKKVLSPMKFNPFKFLKFPGPDIIKTIKLSDTLLQKRIKELAEKQVLLSEERGHLKADTRRLNNINASVNTAIANSQINGVSIQVALTEILKCTSISYQDKQDVINSPTNFNKSRFIDSLSNVSQNAIGSLDEDIKSIKAERDLLNKLIKNNSSKRNNFKFEFNTTLFNVALNVGLLAYWMGGTIPSIGIVTVIFPGVPPTLLGQNVSFKGPSKFFSSLEKIFKMHALTVGGIYAPPPPALPLPWFGYV